MGESENLQKLRKIVSELESKDIQFQMESSNQYKDLTDKIDGLIHEELKKLEFEKSSKNKLQCYEALFASVVCLLEGVKQVV